MYAIRSYYDTRTLRRGELFIALQGPNFDGCDYVSQARDKGAAGAVVPTLVDEDISQITVEDRITSYNVCYTKLLRGRKPMESATENKPPGICLVRRNNFV